ncbi:homeobox protein NANOG [Hippocampus zosterae]|uniref:homeobox protein NANOG n=1 Tax=Hippocampus zosterae TaxID=109293 RepID=UPI00223D8C27|nr:homeobox protein NANOG [Hippocampus zosterae]
MADWKTQINYNYNASYHAYAYGLMYQSGHEQNHCHVTGWGEAPPPDLTNYSPGVTQVYYAATARTREESPPRSPEQHVANGHCRYQGSGLVYLGESQAGRLLLAGTPRAAGESGRAASDSTSDSEAHASPDSWSFGSGRESGLPQADPARWVKKERRDDTNGRSPDAGDHVSSSLMEELPSCQQNANAFSAQAPFPAPSKPSSHAETPKGKVRVSFSESQMHTLVQRFSVQRYLTPAEMKNLAELTGLTYKQVKTWFQNRRMKLRRHQKDNNWVSERYTVTKGRSRAAPLGGGVINHVPTYQAEAQRAPLMERYNHPMMDAAFKQPAPQNLAFYLARMGSSGGSAPLSAWSSGAPQAAMSARPQAVGWAAPAPAGINQHEYNSGVFQSTGNMEPDAAFDGKDAASVTSQNSPMTVIVPNVGQ